MKNIFFILVCLCISTYTFAQKDSLVKRPTVGIHFFFNDFVTAQNINANGFTFKNWNPLNQMQGGFGLDYFQGLNKHIDAVGNLNASWVDYLKPTNIYYGSSNFMLDFNAGTHFKLFSDKQIVNPYLITKVGYLSYQNLKGFNLIPGIGLQFKVFKEIFINSTVEYRIPMTNTMSPQLYYSIGIATNIFKNRKPNVIKPVVVEEPKQKQEPISDQVITKNISVMVNDEATGQPLQDVEVTLKSENNTYTAITNQDGKADFKDVPKDNYDVSGRLNKISSTQDNINISAFSKTGNLITVNLTHNDPRFTLVGVTIDKNANKPIGNTVVTVTNNSQNSTAFVTSRVSDGEFRSQLESNSDFVIVGKKANYISNIENLSTKGLNRSATLYVKLQLGIEEATAGKVIVLNKIFFQTAKSDLNMATSQDLQKLIQFLQDNPNTKLEIQGHTDNVGSMATNMTLSQNRANSVVNYLLSNNIDKNRLIAKGFGPNVPIASNATEAGRSQNRRVEMKVIN